jgi:hypothetical protein
MVLHKTLLLEALESKVKVPAEPGTVPIPSNFIRLYHYTDANPEELWKNGILLSKAQGHTYKEPDFVWASTALPSRYKTYVEFAVPIDDPRFARVFGAAPDPERGPDFYHKRGSDFTFRGDINPKEFIAIHEPWHHVYRYITEDPENIKRTLEGEFDDLIGNVRHPDESKAVLSVKANYGKS